MIRVKRSIFRCPAENFGVLAVTDPCTTSPKCVPPVPVFSCSISTYGYFIYWFPKRSIFSPYQIVKILELSRAKSAWIAQFSSQISKSFVTVSKSSDFRTIRDSECGQKMSSVRNHQMVTKKRGKSWTQKGYRNYDQN